MPFQELYYVVLYVTKLFCDYQIFPNAILKHEKKECSNIFITLDIILEKFLVFSIFSINEKGTKK